MKTRRDFIKTMSMLTGALMVPFGKNTVFGMSESDKWGELLPLRKLGRSNENVTMLGLGGNHIGWNPERDAQEVIETAMEGGVRFFDTAHSYSDGVSEERFGKFLVPKYRDEVFIMTKSRARNGADLLKECDLSLKRMNCDYVDLLQIHSVDSPRDIDNRVEKGVIDAIRKIKDEGKARHIGFTGHQHPLAHLHMLEYTRKFNDFSAVQMPVNLLDAVNEQSFIRDVLPEVMNQKLGLLAMKTLANGRFFGKAYRGTRTIWESDNPVIPAYASVQEALNFAWSFPISVLIVGTENKDLLEKNIQYARDFTALSENDREKLLSKVRQGPDPTSVEFYKDN